MQYISAYSLHRAQKVLRHRSPQEHFNVGNFKTIPVSFPNQMIAKGHQYLPLET